MFMLTTRVWEPAECFSLDDDTWKWKGRGGGKVKNNNKKRMALDLQAGCLVDGSGYCMKIVYLWQFHNVHPGVKISDVTANQSDSF